MKRISILLLTITMVSMGFSGEGQSKKAPNFTLPKLEGGVFELHKELGKGPVLLNFWATWCGPCLREMKKLKKVYKAHSGKGLQIVSISIDDQKTVGQVRGIVKSRRFPYTVVLDTNHEVKRIFQISHPPHTILLNSKGEVVYSHEGYRDGDVASLEAKIVELLEQ
ncbi:MAG: hypothetical protein CSA81_04865 [Acidobacteria bacterium]|nr:MAG: hypothetical protein CSA81_04865 [Acidobacteriota bacterium]PIE91080.1 MAG: hypothetical protein CR997_02875 [Acidobacteriota bacterium]